MQVRIASERTETSPIHSAAVTVPPPVLTFWHALDELLASVTPTRWGAVVTDDRFSAIWDANYARIDADATGVTAAEVERTLLPALAEAGAEVEHVVAFDPDAARDVLAELSSRGHRLSWDVVMMIEEAPGLASDVEVRDVRLADPAWNDVRGSLVASFGIEPGDPLEQLLRLERDVLAPGGKRWFGVFRDGHWVSLAASVVLDGVGYIDNVATEPRFRRRGFASAVTRHVARAAFASGAETVFLLADPQEASTVALYERLGFREVARLGATRGPVPR
jgi:ribosomal protein S18 acetylase RimI-like enzyme